MQSLFPWVGIGEIRDHVEINRYGLLRLINITYQLANGTMEELTELRNMVMQNRVVLDFLTAPQGGVCKIIGPTCCTFVPDETELCAKILQPGSAVEQDDAIFVI
uniref:Uncharacterized protein n=1 Tax=Xiphophorus maculatus TaxID=8083 RepID=A0A3B5QB50_XIPMA